MVFSCDPMTDPVVASDSFTYERETIEKWFETSGNSPRTGALLQHKILGRGSMKGEGKYRALYDDVDHEAQRISRLVSAYAVLNTATGHRRHTVTGHKHTHGGENTLLGLPTTAFP